MPKVSVIIPVYNVAPYLKRCLDSVVNQTLKDIEIICVNDGSTDGSIEILKEYALNDDRIKIIDLPQNEGVSIARNKGLEKACGEFIGFIDSDDYIDLNYYEELYKKAKETNVDIVKCKRVILEKGGSKKVSSLNKSIKTKSKFCFSYEWTTAIYKASLMFENNIRLRPEFSVAEDVVFLNEILLKTDKIEVIQNVRYYYCRRDNSLNEDIYPKEKIFNNLSAVEYILNMYNNSLEKKEISADIYIQQYVRYLNVICHSIINRTDIYGIKAECAEIFIELFNKCKLLPELEKLYSKKNKKLLSLIKDKNIAKIVSKFTKYKTKVSVIVPIYNVEPYIKRCLNSLTNQTLKDIEIICINDCSTDNSLDILKEYARNDKRIIVIDLPQNQGAAVARNKGLEVARGEYLGFVDPDDDLDLNFYEELYKKAAPQKLDIVKTQRIKIEEDGTHIRGVLNSSIRKRESIYYFTYEWQTAIYRSVLIYENNIKFPSDVRKAQDVVFLNKVVLESKTYAIIDNVNYYYYKRPDSLDAKKIPIESIKSALLASEYILCDVNQAYTEGILKKKDYINLYVRRLIVIPNHTMFQNDTKEAKILCMKKFFEMFNKCQLPNEIKRAISPLYRDLINYSDNDDIEDSINFLMNYKNEENYLLFKLRNKVKKDMLYV